MNQQWPEYAYKINGVQYEVFYIDKGYQVKKFVENNTFKYLQTEEDKSPEVLEEAFEVILNDLCEVIR